MERGQVYARIGIREPKVSPVGYINSLIAIAFEQPLVSHPRYSDDSSVGGHEVRVLQVIVVREQRRWDLRLAGRDPHEIAAIDVSEAQLG